MLEVEIKIFGRRIGRAIAVNVSEHGDRNCTYACRSESTASPVTGAPAYVLPNFAINDHDRQQSAWALVAKIAETVAGQENAAAKEKADG